MSLYVFEHLGAAEQYRFDLVRPDGVWTVLESHTMFSQNPQQAALSLLQAYECSCSGECTKQFAGKTPNSVAFTACVKSCKSDCQSKLQVCVYDSTGDQVGCMRVSGWSPTPPRYRKQNVPLPHATVYHAPGPNYFAPRHAFHPPPLYAQHLHLGTPLTDCQAACLKLPPEEQAPCLNECLAALQCPAPPKTGLAAGVAAVGIVGALVVGFVAGIVFQTGHFEEHGVPDWLIEKDKRRREGR